MTAIVAIKITLCMNTHSCDLRDTVSYTTQSLAPVVVLASKKPTLCPKTNPRSEEDWEDSHSKITVIHRHYVGGFDSLPARGQRDQM